MYIMNILLIINVYHIILSESSTHTKSNHIVIAPHVILSESYMYLMAYFVNHQST